jgi:hypothetical protein
VLNGIGGHSIASAKENLTHRETCAWVNYIRKRGSLNLGARIDQAVARWMTLWVNSQGGKAQLSDFMPYADRPLESVKTEDATATLTDAFHLFNALKP